VLLGRGDASFAIHGRGLADQTGHQWGIVRGLQTVGEGDQLTVGAPPGAQCLIDSVSGFLCPFQDMSGILN